MLIIKNLTVAVQSSTIINNLSLIINFNQIHVLMGPNGSGKSSLAYVIMGHPKYQVISGEIIFANQNILELSIEKRARLGIFLSYQYPIAVPGVQIFTFLKEAYRMLSSIELSVVQFKEKLYKIMDEVGLDYSYAYRNLNDGFSGGERKKIEIVQLLLFKPKLAILDEVDSGLDVDALKLIALCINKFKIANLDSSVIIITHYQNILNYIEADFVHIIQNGKILKSGNSSLASIVNRFGYEGLEIEI